jgi:hypothetical protein
MKWAIISIAVTVLALLPVMYWAHSSGKRMRGKLSSEAPAQVTDVSFKEGYKGVRDETTVRYRYVVNGKTYEGEKVNLGDDRRRFRVGAPAKVCYDAKSPGDSQVRELSYQCGS